MTAQISLLANQSARYIVFPYVGNLVSCVSNPVFPARPEGLYSFLLLQYPADGKMTCCRTFRTGRSNLSNVLFSEEKPSLSNFSQVDLNL